MDQEAINGSIKFLEEKTSSKVLVYITNDFAPGTPFPTQVGPDVLPFFKDILEAQGVVDKRTLIINTNGGALNVAWPLVNLIREYTRKEFQVIVPSKSLSVGTLIAIGADKIKMLKGSFLSPIDPTGTFPIQNGTNLQNKACSVEDIMGYIRFAKEKIGLADQAALTETLRLITSEFSTSIIGSLNRTHSLIRSLSLNMLRNRLDRTLDETKIETISKTLIEGLYSHEHLINLKEAKKIGISFASEIEQALNDEVKKLYKIYKDEMYLEQNVRLLDDEIRQITPGTPLQKEVTGAIIHSLESKFSFTTKVTFNLNLIPAGNPNMQINVDEQSWKSL